MVLKPKLPAQSLELSQLRESQPRAPQNLKKQLWKNDIKKSFKMENDAL